MRFLAALISACLFVASTGLSAKTCGAPEGFCSTEHGNYRLVLPREAAGDVPALLFLHGWGSSSARVMRDEALRATLAARGYALIAPEGIPRAGHKNRDWSVRDGSLHPRDDTVFLGEVLDDAAGRGVDRQRVLIAGFSRGASMVWDIACHAPALARGYAAVAGAFWEPLPERCAGPVALFHTHGWTDRVVPLEGRSVAGGRLTQGDVFASLQILRRTLGCSMHTPDAATVEPDGPRWARRWTDCPNGRLGLMLHPGGHEVPADWLTRALDWFEARVVEDPR